MDEKPTDGMADLNAAERRAAEAPLGDPMDHVRQFVDFLSSPAAQVALVRARDAQHAARNAARFAPLRQALDEWKDACAAYEDWKERYDDPEKGRGLRFARDAAEQWVVGVAIGLLRDEPGGWR